MVLSYWTPWRFRGPGCPRRMLSDAVFSSQLHLIHWNSTLFGSIDEAVGKPHGIAIIALFVQVNGPAGRAHSLEMLPQSHLVKLFKFTILLLGGQMEHR